MSDRIPVLASVKYERAKAGVVSLRTMRLRKLLPDDLPIGGVDLALQWPATDLAALTGEEINPIDHLPLTTVGELAEQVAVERAEIKQVGREPP